MDALSLALDNFKLTSPLLARLQLGTDVALVMGDGPTPSRNSPFHYVVAGQCRLVMGSSPLDLRQGDLVVLPRWPPYRLETGAALIRTDIRDLIAQQALPVWSPRKGLDESLQLSIGAAPLCATILSGIFSFEGIEQGALLLDDLPDRLCMNASRRGLGELLEAALGFVMSEAPGRPGYAATALRVLELLLVEALRAWVLETHHSSGRLRGMIDPTLARALRAIHAQPGHRWTIPKLASLAGQSRSRFSEYFARIIGTTPAAYVAQYRFQVAERRLASRRESVAQVANQLGYQSSFAFSRAFRHHRGVTPAHYRRSLPKT
jgi:AraC-like DNA-binding protein